MGKNRKQRATSSECRNGNPKGENKMQGEGKKKLVVQNVAKTTKSNLSSGVLAASQLKRDDSPGEENYFGARRHSQKGMKQRPRSSCRSS